MTGEATLKEVIGRLGKAIDTLEQAVGCALITTRIIRKPRPRFSA